MKFKKTFISVIACMLSLVLMFAFTACSPSETDPVVESISLDITAVTLGPSDTQRLTATVTMSDGSEGSVDEWTSSAESVATVARGIVSAKAAGTATITAKAGEKTATCTVTVENIVVELDKTTLSLERSEAGEQLTATVKKDGTAMSGETVGWSSSDENVAKVDETGFVTPVGEGTATITATRSGHNQKATCAVEIYWDKPVGYNPIAWVEQNKLAQNTWGFWYAQDPSWANGTEINYTEGGVYTSDYTENSADLKDGYEYIGMGKITFEYEVVNPNEIWGVQAFYRSTDNQADGKLAYNHLYELTFTVESNQAGTIGINPYNDIRAQGADESDEDYDAYLAALEAQGKYTPNNSAYEIEAGTQEVKVVFKHNDCGYIFKQGNYDNMGSALHLQLAALADGPVVISVFNFQYKDLGPATYPDEDDFNAHDGYVDINAPTHPTSPEVKSVEASTATKAYLTVEEDKAVFNIEGTLDLSYFNDSADEAKTWLLATRFDMQQCGGEWTSYAFNRISATVDSDGTFLIKYDITYLGVDTSGTGAYSCHFTEKEEGEDAYGDNIYRDLKLDEEHAVPGESITVGSKKYSIVNIVGGSVQADNWGCVSIKVENA